MPYDVDEARRLEQDDMPLLGVKERVRYRAGQRSVVVSRSRREDLAFVLGAGVMVGAALWLMFVDSGGLPRWFARAIGAMLMLVAAGCCVFLLWSPHLVLDKLKGLVLIRTWRFPPVDYLAFERGDIAAFEVYEERISDASGRAFSEPLYYYIYLATVDGVRVPLMRLYESSDVDEFREGFAAPSGVPVLVPRVEVPADAR